MGIARGNSPARARRGGASPNHLAVSAIPNAVSAKGSSMTASKEPLPWSAATSSQAETTLLHPGRIDSCKSARQDYISFAEPVSHWPQSQEPSPQNPSQSQPPSEQQQQGGSWLSQNALSAISFGPPPVSKGMSIADLDWSFPVRQEGGSQSGNTIVDLRGERGGDDSVMPGERGIPVSRLSQEMDKKGAHNLHTFAAHEANHHLAYPATPTPASGQGIGRRSAQEFVKSAYDNTSDSPAPTSTAAATDQVSLNVPSTQREGPQPPQPPPSSLSVSQPWWKHQGPAAHAHTQGATAISAPFLAAGETPASRSEAVPYNDTPSAGAIALPAPVSLEAAMSERYLGNVDVRASEDPGIRVALEQENKELRRLAVACDKRIIESEAHNAQLRREMANIKDSMQVSVVRANEEATLRINQLQMQLAQAQSEAATAADISAEHSRAKLMLGSEIDSLRAENADLKSKLDGAARSAEAEVLALVRENQELTRTLALEQRDMKELERVRADLNEERKKVEGSMLELEHARRQAEDEASYLHEQLRVKTAELGQSREDLSHAARRADMKETQMSTDFESRLKHMAAARDEAAMAAREAREREYAAKNALEQQSVRATQEADLLRRDLSRLQMVAAGAEAAGEESAGLRRQVREITQALDETRAQVDALRVINEKLTARNSSLEATNAGLQGAHTAMAKEKIDRGRQLQEVEGQAKASAARAAASEQQVMNLKKELNAVHAEMHARARGDAAEVQTGSSVGGGGAGGVATLQQQVQTLCQDREVAIATGEKMAQKLREFEEENTRLNEEFRAVTADAQAAKAQVAMLQAMQRAAFSSNHANTEAVDAAKSNTPMTAIRHQQLVSITTPPPQTKVPDRQGAREEEALAVTRRLLDLERGTGKLLRERNGHLETQVDDQEKHIKSLNSQLVHAQHELGAKQAEVDEVRAISAAWMAAKPTTKERQDGDKEGGVGKQMREASFGAASERQVLGRLFRGCQVGITPACITLHFSGRGTQDAAGHDDKNSGGAVVEAECGRDATWVGGDVLEVMCNLLTESLGVPAETLVPIFVEKVGESSAGGFVVGVLALCSNHLLQAHGLYQVAEAETPAGIAQRLCTSVSSLPLSPLLSDTRVVGKLGTLDRVDASVVMSRGASDLSQELDENKMLDVIARMEAERDVREQELTKLRNLATSLSRRLADHTQDGGFGEEELMIPRDKLEEVLQDAQERVDEAEARAEQLAVQLLLLQHADARLKAPGEDIAHSFVRDPPQDECVNGEVQETRRAGMNGDDDVAELWEVNRNLSQHPHSHVSDEPGVLASDVRTQRENLDALWDGAHGDRRGGEVYEHEPEDLMHEGDHQMENDLPEGAEDELWGTDDAPLQSEQGSKQIWGARVP